MTLLHKDNTKTPGSTLYWPSYGTDKLELPELDTIRERAWELVRTEYQATLSPTPQAYTGGQT